MLCSPNAKSIDHKIMINQIINGYGYGVEQSTAYSFRHLINYEIFEAMDFTKIDKEDNGAYTLTRQGYSLPHYIFLPLQGGGWAVWGR